MSKYIQFMKKRKTTLEKLLQFHIAFENVPKGDAKAHSTSSETFPKPLVQWVNRLFKEQTGIGLNSSFRAHTLWSNIQGNKKGALFKTGLIVTRFDITEESIKYRIFLSSHNTEADTDMSDSDIMSIDFKVELPNHQISEYSYNF